MDHEKHKKPLRQVFGDWREWGGDEQSFAMQACMGCVANSPREHGAHRARLFRSLSFILIF